jgi:hypothetical protein
MMGAVKDPLHLSFNIVSHKMLAVDCLTAFLYSAFQPSNGWVVRLLIALNSDANFPEENLVLLMGYQSWRTMHVAKFSNDVDYNRVTNPRGTQLRNCLN